MSLSRLVMGIGADARLKPIAFLAVTLGAILTLVALMGRGVPESSTAGKPLGTAPDFTLSLFDGGELTLSDLRGQVVLLNFWASWCPPCRDEAPALERAWQSYKGKGVVFVGVDVNDREENARAFLKEFGLDYPTGADPSDEIATRYRVSGIPATIFINRDGMIVRRWTGPLQEKQLLSFIEEALR